MPAPKFICFLKLWIVDKNKENDIMKYGKRNEIKLDPLKYNLMLIGESGIGKSTVIKEYCEKLAGENGYIMLEIGKEDGVDAIANANYINCPEWDSEYDEDTNTIGFATFIDDVIENKFTDWKDLKVVVIDTIDELFSISEPEVIRMHNKENPNKKIKSIRQAFGGFSAGEDKAVEIVLEKLWGLKKVGVSFVVIGHTKSRNVTDPVTGEEYMQLTTNMAQKYFNSVKTKVHLLGVAAIDRKIVREKSGKKDFVTKEEIKKGVVKSETRKITFRDDNFVIDSKSRFANIVESIPLDSDELIKAIADAIKAEQSKTGINYKELEKEQKISNERREKKLAESELNRKKSESESSKLNEIKANIVSFFMSNKTDIAKISPVLAKCKELGYSNPNEIDDIEKAELVLAMCG